MFIERGIRIDMGMFVTIGVMIMSGLLGVMRLARFASVIVLIAMRAHSVQVPDRLDRHQDRPVPGCAGWVPSGR